MNLLPTLKNPAKPTKKLGWWKNRKQLTQTIKTTQELFWNDIQKDTCDGAGRESSEACRAWRKLLLFRPRAWNPNCPKVSLKQAISYLSHFSQAKLAFPFLGKRAGEVLLVELGKDAICPKWTAKSQQQCLPGPQTNKTFQATFLQEGNLSSFGVESTQCKLPKLFFTCWPATGA